MGTHPIFESDFDCLTELCKKMVELESPVHVHCDKETPVHVYVRKNGAKTKSATKTRARSPTKKRSEQASSPSRRPWIPAPGRSTLSDLKAEMARAGKPVDRDVCVQQRRGTRPSREALQNSISAYESNIASLLNEMGTLKTRLSTHESMINTTAQSTTKPDSPRSTRTVVEKADQDVESLAAEMTAKASKEDDEYTEVASNVQVIEDVVVEEAQLKPLVEPAVSRVYASHYEPELNALLDADRSRLQKLLLSAELDLETLDFSDPQASARFLTTSRHIRAELAALKRANFDVSRLEQQRDAVIERLAKSDSEITLARRALYGKESDLRETQIDNELNQEKINRLQVHNDNLESVKAKIHRELFTREGELNRSQARERVAHKEIAELRADLEYEKSQNGKAKLDLEKQALKKACKHHKHKAESFLVQLDESRLDCKRVRSELDAWKERSRRNIDAVEDQAAALHETQRGAIYAEEKLYAASRQVNEKEVIIEEQAAEIGKLRVHPSETKSRLAKTESTKQSDIDNAREDALASLQTLRDLPEELQIAHRRLDEAIREIRKLEESNADLEVRLHRANTAANLSESAEAEVKIYNQKLNSAEIRLEELQRSLNEVNDENDQLRQDATNWHLHADERQHTIQALEGQIAEHRRALESENEKFAIKERSNNNRLSEIELELTRLNGELSAVRRQKEEAERRGESQLHDIRDRLEHSEATNRSMQSYVNFLKSSYQNTFGDDLTE